MVAGSATWQTGTFARKLRPKIVMTILSDNEPGQEDYIDSIMVYNYNEWEKNIHVHQSNT